MTLRFQHKLSIPTAAYQLIERTPVIDQLDQAITTKQVVALGALAGWGKTTVLAQWAARAALPVAWYTLDSTDRDPHLFLDYLLYAVRASVPEAADLAVQLTNTTPNALPDLFRSAALAIAAAPEPFALILDDYHVLEDDALPVLPGMELIFDLLAQVAEYAQNCHLVIASRMLPNLRGIARLTAQRRAVFFDYAMLQWSADEVRRLAESSSGDISPEHAGQLVSQMSGWVTGIVLSLDHVVRSQQQPTPDVLADTGSVYAYFAEQIIAPLAPALQQFLEATSVLEDLSPVRCNTLCQINDAAALLAEITRRGLFVSHKGGTLAYHSLFRDFLRGRLAQDPVRERALLLRAAELYAEEEDLERALESYLAAAAEQPALDLLRATIARFRQRSRQNTLLACFERLSTYLERVGKGRLLPADLLLAQVRVYNDLALWERAELAIQLAETIGDELVRSEAAILYAEVMILRGNLRQAQSALDYVPGEKLPPRLRFEYHRTAGRVQIFSGDISSAIRSLEAAQILAPVAVDSGEMSVQLATIADNLGWAYSTQGDYQSALRYLKRADACWQASGNSGRRAMTLNNIGSMAMLEGSLAEAHAALESGLEIARQTARHREEAYLWYSMGELDITEGNPSQAVERFREARDVAVRMGVAQTAESAAVGALWATALMGDASAAAHWQRQTATAVDSTAVEVRARKALADSLLAIQLGEYSCATLAELANVVAGVGPVLQAPERAYLALLRASLLFEQDGWAHAAPAWDQFEAQAAKLPPALLRCFVPPYQRVFKAAAGSSPLAQHLLETTKIPVTVRWQIAVLGSFMCLVDTQPCELSPLHRALLVRLLDAGPAGLTVERLWEEVWGDTDIRMAALHKALARLREQTGLPMAARAGHCAIEAAWESIGYDAQDFERALATFANRQDLEQAVALYHGDFLPGATPSAALWVDRRRSHLQQLYLDALEQLAKLIEDDEPKQAIQHYQHILRIDGCREETAAQLMRLAARQRNHALVNATYEQLEGALRTLGASPEPATIALLRASSRGRTLERPRTTP
ncbi:MAG TPA: tetratricopeptide repeat protein [Roseiflexaceae bacterium]|nr:tetratricopeptide repeat protein [Roseiflexaceae bacterium]